MDAKTFSLVAGVIFAVVALFHLVRIFMEWTVTIGDWSVPMWVSWIAFVVAGGLALLGLRLSERWREEPFQFGGDPLVPTKAATTPKAPVTAAAAKATANNSWSPRQAAAKSCQYGNQNQLHRSSIEHLVIGPSLLLPPASPPRKPRLFDRPGERPERQDDKSNRLLRCLAGRSHREASACLAATRRFSSCHGLGIKSTPSGSWPSSGCPDVRITGRKGQRILTSRAKSIPSITPGSRISAKIMATSRPRISIVARAASALSHSMVSSSLSSSSLAANSRSSASSSTIKTARRFCWACPIFTPLP